MTMTPFSWRWRLSARVYALKDSVAFWFKHGKYILHLKFNKKRRTFYKKYDLIRWKMFRWILALMSKNYSSLKPDHGLKKEITKSYTFKKEFVVANVIFNSSLDYRRIIIEAINLMRHITFTNADGKMMYIEVAKERFVELLPPAIDEMILPDCDCEETTIRVALPKYYHLVEAFLKMYWVMYYGKSIDTNGFTYFAVKLLAELREIECEMGTKYIYNVGSKKINSG